MTLDRMLVRLYLKTLLATLSVLLMMAVIGEFFESCRHFMSGNGTARDVLMFYLYRSPVLAQLLLPISLVVSVFVLFARLGRNLELRALSAAGISPLRLAGPITAVALVTMALTVEMGETLIPNSLDRMDVIMVEKFGRIDATWRFYKRHQWYQSTGNRLLRVGVKTANAQIMRFVTLLELDPSFHLTRRSEFDKVTWNEDHWVGEGITIHELKDGELSSFRQIPAADLSWPESPEHFRELLGRPKQKSTPDLMRAIEQMESKGVSAAEYRMELHNRFVFPVLAVALVLLVLPWLVRPTYRSTLAAALTEATMVVFGAYFLIGIMAALAMGERMSVAFSAWLPVGMVLVLVVLHWGYRAWQKAV